MTRDEFHQMLEANGIVFVGDAAWRVAQLVAAAEREACARVCEMQDEEDTRFRYDYRRGALDCADAIRARGQS